MPTIDFTSGEVRLRFAAVGPVRAGKSSLLRRLHAILPPAERGEISMRVAGAEEIISFDFTPIDLIPAGSNRVVATLFAFTGQNADTGTRARHLADLDAVLFVADSQQGRLSENLSSLQFFAAIRSLRDVPVLFVYNKRDLPDAVSMEQLQESLNPGGASFVEASSFTGGGCEKILSTLISAAFAAE